MPEPIPADEVIDLIAAIRDALDAPDPAGDYSAYERLITMRASYLRGVLKDSAAGNLRDLAITAQAVRNAVRVVPVRYVPEGGAS